MAALLRLAYFSASRLTSQWDIVCLVEQSRLHNARNGISGLLLHEDGAFLQFIEGEKAAVETLYRKILRDPRHSYVTQICNQETDARLFGEWPLAFLGRVEYAQASQSPHREVLDSLKQAYRDAEPPAREVIGGFF